MGFFELLAQIIELLQREQRVSYRALQREFGLDDAYLEDLKAELIEVKQLAVDHEGRMLLWTGDPASPSTPIPLPSSTPPRRQEQEPVSYTPQHLVEKILRSRADLEGERKQVTVLFADIKESTELIKGLDPEAAQQLLDPALHHMMDAVHRFEGTVNQVLGDGIMALFGAPIAHEDHALRGEVWDKALTYGRQAGAKAMVHSAYHEAVVCFEQALAALAQLPECHDTLAQAVDLRCDLYNALLPLDEQARLFDHLRAAEALAERLDDPQRLGRVGGYLCIHFSTIGEHDRAIAAGQRALALATASGAFDVQVTAQTYLGQAYHAVGDFQQSLDFSRRVMALLTGELLYARLGRVAPPALSSRAFIVWCLAELGGFAEGRSVTEEAVRLAEAIEQPYSITALRVFIGAFYRRQGVLRMAIPTLEQGLAMCQSANIPRFFPVIAACLGAAYALAGRVAEALPLLDQVLERIASGSPVFQHAVVLTELSETLLLVGRVDEASALAGHLLDLSRTHIGRGYQAHACRLLGDVARHREPPNVAQAAAYYRQALALAEEAGMRPLQAHCHLGIGTLYARTGQQEQAHAALSAAIDLYRAMEMIFWQLRAEMVLAQSHGLA